MSQENVEVVRGLFESWNGHQIAETIPLFDSDIEFDARELPMPDINRVYRGLEDMGSWVAAWLSAWEHLDAHPIWIEAQDERVVAWLRMRMVGKESGVPVEEVGGWGFTFREGKISHVRLFVDEVEAQRTVGLGE